eukprot:GHUV01006637.1.p1 GENE.GHUV01006637.1~~GHUV01006637.1.p1  ORF type:complete len:139 (-),score=15.29 GHUV01006637.1:1030-1446(-)
MLAKQTAPDPTSLSVEHVQEASKITSLLRPTWIFVCLAIWQLIRRACIRGFDTADPLHTDGRHTSDRYTCAKHAAQCQPMLSVYYTTGHIRYHSCSQTAARTQLETRVQPSTASTPAHPPAAIGSPHVLYTVIHSGTA